MSRIWPLLSPSSRSASGVFIFFRLEEISPQIVNDGQIFFSCFIFVLQLSFNNPHMRKPGWRWKWAGRASLEDRSSLLVTGGCWLMRRKVTGRIPSLLAVRLPCPHRTLAQTIGRLPQAASGACPGHRALAPGRIGRLSRPHRCAPPVSIYAALIRRTPNRYGRAHTQAAPGAVPGIYASNVTGRTPSPMLLSSSCMP